MAVTETPPETAEADAGSDNSEEQASITGLAGLLGSGDHKVIGRMYVVFSLLLGALVLTLGEAMAVEAVEPDTVDIFTTGSVYQLFTLTRLGTVFLLALPLIIGVAMVVVPLQVGASAIAFPRAAAASLWGWLLGSGIFVASYALDGGPGGESSDAVNLWLAAMGLILLSLLLAAICLATTVLALRTTGLSLERAPLFAWSILVASIMWLFTLPVLFGVIVLMYVDHRHAGGIYLGQAGTLFDSVAWFLRNPQIYVLAIPALGFAADVLSTASGTRMKSRGMVQSSIAAFGIFSFGAFMVVPSEAALDSLVVVALGVLAVVPVLGVIAACADLFRKGRLEMSSGVVYAACALLVLLLATVAGAIGSVPDALDAPEGSILHNNIFFLGVSHATVLAGVLASLGGLHWWATKIGRQPANERLGMVAPLVILLGTVASVVPDLIAGLTGEGAELLADYSGGTGALNVVAALGIGLVSLGVILAAVSFIPLLRKPADDVPADPWEGQTLEWLTASPPSVGNFDTELAAVTSSEPLIDLREEK